MCCLWGYCLFVHSGEKRCATEPSCVRSGAMPQHKGRSIQWRENEHLFFALPFASLPVGQTGSGWQQALADFCYVALIKRGFASAITQ